MLEKRLKEKIMSKILVPTDFSFASKKSLDYASKICEVFNSDITLLWVDNFDANTSLHLEENLQAALRIEAKEELTELIESQSVIHPSVKYTPKIKTGKVYREVASIATIEKSPLIVISTTGGSGFEDFWIGSNAYRIISAAPCPVVSVKPTFAFNDNPVSRILVPIDHTPDTLDKLPAIINFASKFNAEINIMAIYTTSLKTLHKKVENSATTAQKMITDSKLPFSFDELKTNNVVSDLIKFMENSSIDLIAIMTEKDNSEQSGIGQMAKQVINRSPIPVLSIR